jgi:hypothetical protein
MQGTEAALKKSVDEAETRPALLPNLVGAQD